MTAWSSSRARVLRPGDGLEVRGRPGRHRLPVQQGLGKDYKGDLFVGSARGALRNGNLFQLQISGNRKEVDSRPAAE